MPVMTSPIVEQGQTRPDWAFPFVPARMAEAPLEHSIQKLCKLSASAKTIVAATSGPIQEGSLIQTTTRNPVSVIDPVLAQWAEDGSRKKEWLEKKE